MAELEDLSARLSRLAAAVPASSGQLDQVHREAVQARHHVRVAWITPLVVIVVGVVVVSAVGVGPFAPGATSGPSSPVSATTRSSDFELTITSAKSHYTRDEPVQISAFLTFRGSGEARIAHAQGARVPGRGTVVGPDTGGSGGPIGFGIDEPVLGALRLAPNWSASCERTTLPADDALRVPFEKASGWSSDDPRSAEYQAFVLDPILYLKSGRWHPYAVAEFSIGDCGGEQVKMRVGLEITVGDQSDEEPTDLAAGPVAASTREGPYSLSLQASRGVVEVGEPIEDWYSASTNRSSPRPGSAPLGTPPRYLRSNAGS